MTARIWSRTTLDHTLSIHVPVRADGMAVVRGVVQPYAEVVAELTEAGFVERSAAVAS